MASGHGQGSMSVSMKFIRLLIVLLNLAFIVVGIALIAIGAYVVKDPKMQQLRPLLNPDLTSAYSQSLSNIEIFAIVIIAIGGVLLFIGFLGKIDTEAQSSLITFVVVARMLWFDQRFPISSYRLRRGDRCNHHHGNSYRDRFHRLSESISIGTGHQTARLDRQVLRWSTNVEFFGRQSSVAFVGLCSIQSSMLRSSE